MSSLLSFKLKTVLEVISGSPQRGGNLPHGKTQPTLLRTWRDRCEASAPKIFDGKPDPNGLEARAGQLERLLGKQELEIEILKKLQTC